MRVAEHFEDLIDFVNETINESNYELERIEFSTQNQWRYFQGSISHVSGGFFHVVGLTSIEEEKEHLIYYQPQSALTGLALHKNQNSVYLLLQARVEPGNTKICQYGPTIQSTSANFTRLHGGKPTNYLDLFYTFSKEANLISFSMQTDLGKRYYQKSKTHNFVEVPRLLPTEQYTIWVDLKTLVKALDEDFLLNTDLRSLLAVFDWNALYYKQQDVFLDTEIEILKRYLQFKTVKSNIWKFCPLEQLKQWKKDKYGISSLNGTGVSLNMYRTTSYSREVARWEQPLMEAHTLGWVLLLRRVKNGKVDYLLSIVNEMGIDGQVIIGPTYTLYPGEKLGTKPEVFAQGETYVEFLHSEEGGRFIKHESHYRIATVNFDIELHKDQYWVSSALLKKLLSTSNMISIQLRVICSALIRELNPLFFSKENLERS